MSNKEIVYKWKKDNPERWKEISNKAQKKWRENNKEKKAAYAREYRLKNRDKLLEYNSIWKQNNKQLVKINNKKHSTSENKKKLFQKIVLRDGRHCKQCYTTENLTIQHIKPRCIGGGDKLENLEILCKGCNIKDYHRLVKKSLKLYFETI